MKIAFVGWVNAAVFGAVLHVQGTGGGVPIYWPLVVLYGLFSLGLCILPTRRVFNQKH